MSQQNPGRDRPYDEAYRRAYRQNGGSSRVPGAPDGRDVRYSPPSGDVRFGANAGGRSDGGMSQEDFEALCRGIEETVVNVSKATVRGLGAAGAAMGDAIGQVVDGFQKAQAQKQVEHRKQRAQQAQTAELARAEQRRYQALMKTRYRSTGGLTASGVVMTSLGGMLTFAFGADALVASGLVFAQSLPVAVVIMCGVLAGLSAWLLSAGIKRLRLAGHMKAFKRVLGDREACTIAELASQTQMTKPKALAAARKMLKRGLLPQGHLDDEGTCLIVTDNAYHQYREAQREYQRRISERRAKEQAKLRQAKNQEETLPSDAVAFIKQGGSYLQQLRELDVAIDDTAVSAKIASIENTVGRILARVEAEPSVLAGLDRMMDYYLPTTVKLLGAYADLERESVQGQNITASRTEIEQTLDVLHTAYEKLLDETFQDLSMDVSSDISVLQAVLAQDGLVESPFDKKG